MGAKEDFFNITFPPSVSKDNQMREMFRSCVHVHVKCDYRTISLCWSLRDEEERREGGSLGSRGGPSHGLLDY